MKNLQNQKIYYLFIFLTAFAFFFWLQYSPDFADPDSFYHAKMAILTQEQGIMKTFPWLQFTTLKDNFADHHFVYHLLLIPFVDFLSPLAGIKLATALLAGILILAFYWFLKKYKIQYAAFFTIFLLAVNPFIFRMSLAKASSLSLIFLIAGIYFIFEKKYWPLFFLSFFYVWSYGGWPLLIALVLIYLAVELLMKIFTTWQEIIKKTQKQGNTKTIILNLKSEILNLKSSAAVLAGSVAGLVINPFFPQNLKFYWQQIAQIAVVNFQDKIGVGSEWYPYGFLNLANNASLLFILLAIALPIFFINVKKQSTKSIFFFFCFLFFLLLTLKSRRNVEYFVPFAVLFSAFAINDAIKKTEGIINFIKKLWVQQKISITLTAVVLLPTLLLIAGRDIKKARADLTNGFAITRYQGAAEWLRSNASPNSIVLHSDWDDFPVLFYHNHHNYYIVGLDPTFMYLYDKKLYAQWVDITLGKTADNLYNIIRNDFRASYVFIDTQHPSMENNLKRDSHFTEIYRDGESIIYKIATFN